MDLFWFVFFWIALFVLVFAWPAWPYARAREWGYTPSAVAGVIAVVLLLLFWLGVLSVWPWAAYR